MQSYRVALGRLVPGAGDTAVDAIDAPKVAGLVADLHAGGLRKQTIRKTVSVLAMILDHSRIASRPVRFRGASDPRLPRQVLPASAAAPRS
jgi:hypothetical protein